MTRRRSRWRAWLLLARVSNLPTVWTNVLAGLAASGAAFGWREWLWLSGAVSLLYTGGMFLNDAFDAVFDAEHRADRPIPAGDATRPTVFAMGFVLIAAGELAIAARWPDRTVVLWAALLGVAIIYYDYRHKRVTTGPAVMGVCRGLVYAVAAVSVAGHVGAPVLVAAAALTAYVIALTWVAKRSGERAGWLVPVLIAGISLVDAAVVVTSGSAVLGVAAALGFALTLALQRVVPGT